MVRFDPKLHISVTDKDRKAIENALWEGWELMVDETIGEVWIGDREEKIAMVKVGIVDSSILVSMQEGTPICTFTREAAVCEEVRNHMLRQAIERYGIPSQVYIDGINND